MKILFDSQWRQESKALIKQILIKISNDIPNLQFDSFSVQVDSFHNEVDTFFREKERDQLYLNLAL